MTLHDRTAVITGAGSGIGRAIAQSLATRGCHLALADISEPGLAETERLLGGPSIRVSCHTLDVADRTAAADLPQAVLAQHGRVDLLFNNAGVALAGTFEQISETDFDWLLEINFGATVRLTRAFLPYLNASDDARIVNMSSFVRPHLAARADRLCGEQVRRARLLKRPALRAGGKQRRRYRGAPWRGCHEDCRECAQTRRRHQRRGGGAA
jgi:NAD(P)-dependent dehydrogenase (short-subunit alcohol dehydrogenase family)